MAPAHRALREPFGRECCMSMQVAAMSYTGELRFVIVARRTTTYDVFDVSMQSPLVSTDQIAGLLNTLAQTSCSKEHNIITARKSAAYDDDQLLAILNALEILGFAGTSDGAVQLTPVGQHYATASTHERRLIFADRLMLPSVKLIQTMVASHPGYQVHGAEIVAELGHRYLPLPM